MGLACCANTFYDSTHTILTFVVEFLPKKGAQCRREIAKLYSTIDHWVPDLQERGTPNNRMTQILTHFGIQRREDP